MIAAELSWPGATCAAAMAMGVAAPMLVAVADEGGR